eukprot:5699347-Pyramimonas_sp.AAC.1
MQLPKRIDITYKRIDPRQRLLGRPPLSARSTLFRSQGEPLQLANITSTKIARKTCHSAQGWSMV